MQQLGDVLHAMNSHGFPVDNVVPDGKMHRFKRFPEDSGKPAFYVCFQNVSNKGETFFVAEFGDWREPGENKKFMTNFVQTKHDKKVIEAQMKEAQARFEMERSRVWEEASDATKIEWQRFRTAGTSEYLSDKSLDGGCLYGARYLPGAIYVPVRDVNSKIWGYQKILDDGGKYFRECTKKDGNFHVIGEWKNTDVLYLCEGFATGITVHLATGKPVAVCFDAGNLSPAAAALRVSLRDCAFIFCGDDDRWTTKQDGTPWNPGREKAEEAALQFLGRAVFPDFKDLGTHPTDWNDLLQLEGETTVKTQLEGVVVEAQRIVCLGHLGDSYFYTSSSNQQIVPISRGSHVKHSLLDLMPLAYWESQYPAKLGVDWDRAASEMMDNCRSAGIFHPENVRGAGVWRDAGRTVVNMGNRLSVDGEIVPVSGIRGKFIYEIARRIQPIHENPLTDIEGVKFLEALELMRWRKPEFAKLAAGWLMVAPLSGALPWRPHLWVTGPSGSGKTWFSNVIVAKVLGENKISVKGATTEAGIRQTIRSDALPLVFDEFETDDERSAERIRGLLELIRQASSEDDGFVVKGTTSGKSVQYRVRFSALVSSIRLNLEREQDKNRFTVLDLERGTGQDNSAQLDRLRAALSNVDDEFGRRMFARGVRLLPVILANQETLSRLLADRHDSRFGQHYGILLAGYGALVHDEPLKEDEAKFLIESLDLESEVEAVEERDELECFDHLLRNVRTFDVGERREYSVSEMIQHCSSEICSVKEKSDEALQRIGIRLHKECLCVSITHPSIRSLFRGTKWTSNWSKPLLRIKGSRPLTVRVDGRVTKCVSIPLEAIGYKLQKDSE